MSLSRARAAGVRAASAPIVFVGETHCFPEPDMCSRLLAGFTDEQCAAVVPAIVNANPKTALSWASYLTDYGGWGPGRISGRLEQPLKYNGAYRRDVLLELGDRLDDLLDANNEELWSILHQQGYYSCFDRDARANHVNATKLRVMLRIRFFSWRVDCSAAGPSMDMGAAAHVCHRVPTHSRGARLARSIEHSIWCARPATTPRHNSRYFCGGAGKSDRRSLGIPRA